MLQRTPAAHRSVSIDSTVRTAQHSTAQPDRWQLRCVAGVASLHRCTFASLPVARHVSCCVDRQAPTGAGLSHGHRGHAGHPTIVHTIDRHSMRWPVSGARGQPAVRTLRAVFAQRAEHVESPPQLTRRPADATHFVPCRHGRTHAILVAGSPACGTRSIRIMRQAAAGTVGFALQCYPLRWRLLRPCESFRKRWSSTAA
jgi:hypothetical protein